MTVPTRSLPFETTGFSSAAPTARIANRRGLMIAAKPAKIEGGPQGSQAVQSRLGVELVVRGTTAHPRQA